MHAANNNLREKKTTDEKRYGAIRVISESPRLRWKNEKKPLRMKTKMFQAKATKTPFALPPYRESKPTHRHSPKSKYLNTPQDSSDREDPRDLMDPTWYPHHPPPYHLQIASSHDLATQQSSNHSNESSLTWVTLIDGQVQEATSGMELAQWENTKDYPTIGNGGQPRHTWQKAGEQEVYCAYRIPSPTWLPSHPLLTLARGSKRFGWVY